MLFFYLLAIVVFMVNALVNILPCGALSDTCVNPFLPLPEQVGDAFELVGNTFHWIAYLFGDSIGNAIMVAVPLLLYVELAQLLYRALLYVKIPVVSNIMSMFRADVKK